MQVVKARQCYVQTGIEGEALDEPVTIRLVGQCSACSRQGSSAEGVELAYIQYR